MSLVYICGYFSAITREAHQRHRKKYLKLFGRINMLNILSSNLQDSDQVLKKINNPCQVKSPQYSHDCQDCRYRHKGICNVFFEGNIGKNNIDESKNLEEKIEIKTIPELVESEPVLNLKNLFFEIKVTKDNKKLAEIFPQKARYDNFKLLTDISRVLQKCQHLTPKDRLNYCNTQRYFMKLYLREINKPE
ncbi:MAG: hypothetical protein ACW96X_09235 [Promethearchaeota archaeon]|jgi:hypothetical protein